MMNIEEIICSIIDLDNTYIGEAPINIDNCQWIRNSSGPSEDHFDLSTYDSLGFRIYVRNTSNKEAYNIIYDIYKKLKSYVGANYVIIVRRLPHYIGRDDKYRCAYSLNIEFQLGGY